MSDLAGAANMIVAALDTAIPHLAGVDQVKLTKLIAEHTTCGWTVTPIRPPVAALPYVDSYHLGDVAIHVGQQVWLWLAEGDPT